MGRKRSKKHLKKYLRKREKVLKKYLSLFLDGYDLEQSLDNEKNFQLLLNLRWLIYDFIYVRLKLNRKWIVKKWFLDLFDVERVSIENDSIELSGDIVWWAEGKDVIREWWTADHEPYLTGVYKVKIRGDLDGGYWVIEPVTAKFKKSKIPKRKAKYEIDFGKGITHMKILNR